jgi:threonine aldolase
MIDLRSDTVTMPSAEMKEFMFAAKVGDDVFGEDPSINELEDYAAKLFGKEAGLYCSSGTQTNQIAISVYCRPGDEVICSKEAHIYKYEGGGIARNAGASVKLLNGDRGRISAEDVREAFNDPSNPHYPLTTLVALEDTMNRGGGAIYNFDEIQRIKKLCNELNLPLHLDGARVFNALVETGIDYKTYGNQFDSISICLSKGLGAPVGSVLIGNKDFIAKARRVRKVFGGGMRQAGIIAAGGLFALQHHIKRLKEDHRRAKELEKVLFELEWVNSVVPVETNIIVAELAANVEVNKVVRGLKDQGILIMPFGGQSIRMVTHLDIHDEDIQKITKALGRLKV